MNEAARKKLWEDYARVKTPDLREKLILEYAPLVKVVAGRLSMYLGYNVEYEDLVSYGVFGLIDAIDKFDMDKNVKFETFISKRIKGMIIDLARKQDWVPRSTRKSTRDIEEAVTTLYNRLGYYPSVQEVTEYLNITPEKYQETMRKASLFNVLSLDMVLAEAQGNEAGVTLPQGEKNDQPESQFLKKELTEVLAEGIGTLKENEQLVISLYYIDELNMRQIADVLKVSEPRVSQIHTNAIKKLRKHMERFNEEKESRNVSRVL